MARRTWLTNPSGNGLPNQNKRYTSFYMYDDITQNFVRIRLDMDRPDGDEPCIIIRSNRVVGFSRLKGNVTVGQNGIIMNNVVLNANPRVDDWEYDGTPGRGPHYGHQVTTIGYFPPDVTEDFLYKIAEKFIGLEDDTIKIEANTPQELSDYLHGLID